VAGERTLPSPSAASTPDKKKKFSTRTPWQLPGAGDRSVNRNASRSRTRCCYSIHPDTAASFETRYAYESRRRTALRPFSQARLQYLRDLRTIRVLRQINHETDNAPEIKFGGFQSEPEVFHGPQGLIPHAGFVQFAVGAPPVLSRECEFTGSDAWRKKHLFGKKTLQI
jgi:hypothetical protein